VSGSVTISEVTQEPLIHVDCTPDEGYPLRILRAHRENCNCRWQIQGLDEAAHILYARMNGDCARRAEILDAAIAHLEGLTSPSVDASESDEWFGTQENGRDDF
jgi:hypothetical protein